jgi:hypothetical protein
MNAKSAIHIFIYSAAGILLLASMAKLISSFGNGEILIEPDPILIIPFKWMLRIVGGLELIVSFVCFLPNRRTFLQAGLVAFLSTNFIIYRMGLTLVGYHKPCGCLGGLTQAIHMSPEISNLFMEALSIYLLLGSYSILFWLWKRDSIINPS